jgi:hypothetical protein
MIDDALVCLVRHVDVDLVDAEVALRQDLLGRADHHARGELEDLGAVHLHELVGLLEVPRAAARQPQVLAAAPVRAELEPQEAAVGHRLHDDGARPVSEEDERRAIVPVEDLREEVAADDERPPREARRDHAVGLREGVHETRAAGMSGVTVATTIRSTDDASTPASSSALRAAGAAMSVSASSFVAKRRSRMPVRSTIHSSVVSTNCSRSLFVKIRSGTWTPRPVMPMRLPLAEPITSGPPRT